MEIWVSECAPPLAGWVDSRRVSPPEEARRLGLALVADIERWTPLCEGDCALVVPVLVPETGWILRSDKELPDREPSLSG